MLFYKDLADFVTGQKEKLDKLVKTNIPERGLILKVLVPNENQDKASNVAGYSITHEVDQIQINHLGIVGDRHYRPTRPSTGREKSIYPKGTMIKENRHIFVVSPFDCKVISDLLGAEVTPELLGANLVIGREDEQDYSLSSLPQSTYLLLAQKGSTDVPKPPIATLIHYVLQQGCVITGNTIAQKYGDRSLSQMFISQSKINRGIVCSVEHPVEIPAPIQPGNVVFFKFPMGVAP